MIKRLGQRKLQTQYGIFEEILYYDGKQESIALVRGDVSGGENILCRVHAHCIGAHVFNSTECTCREEMASAQAAIESEGRGIVIWLDQEGKGNGHLALIESIPFKKEFGQAEAYEKAGYRADARDYRPAAQILKELEVKSIILLTNNRNKISELQNFGIDVTDIREMTI